MNIHRCQVVKSGLALLLILLVSQRALVQQNNESKLDDAAKRFLGTFTCKVELLVATYTISHADGKWAVSAVFKEKGRNIGAFEGTEVQYQDGTLTFKQKYLAKPRPNWIDNERFTLKLAGGQVVGIGESKDARLRTFEPATETAPVNPAAKTKDDNADLKKVIGYWVGESGDGKYKTFLHIEHVKEKWSLNVNYFSKAGKLQGNGIGTDLKAEDGALTFTLKFIKRPEGYPDNAKRRVECLVDNTLTYSQPEGKGWKTNTTYMRAKK